MKPGLDRNGNEIVLNGDYRNHVFGKEETVEEIVRRIAWETEMEGRMRDDFPLIADCHASTRRAYIMLLSRN